MARPATAGFSQVLRVKFGAVMPAMASCFAAIQREHRGFGDAGFGKARGGMPGVADLEEKHYRAASRWLLGHAQRRFRTQGKSLRTSCQIAVPATKIPAALR